MVIQVLRFADREFYRDWWNSNNVLDFWKTWNLPVHRWAVRHLFKGSTSTYDVWLFEPHLFLHI